MITLDDARRHLRIDGNDFDAEIAQKMVIVNAMILAYVSHIRGDQASAEIIAAESIRMEFSEALDAARLMSIGELWINREGSADPLSPGVKNILNLFREPGYA